MQLAAATLPVVIVSVAGSVVAPPSQQTPRDIALVRAPVDPASAVIVPAGELVAALPYDGVAQCAHKAQDFESVYDAYDIFVIEDIEPASDFRLATFRSFSAPTGDPDEAEDFVVRIFENNGTGLPGQDQYTGQLVLTSLPGAGFWDPSTSDFITDFGGQCLPAGSYFLLWAVRLDFSCCGQVFFLDQAGEPQVGGGGANNAWQWCPGLGHGSSHFPVQDCDTREQTGVNYLLFGDPANCDFPCSNPDCPADLDGDGDTDADDFFAYLDLFVNDDPCADIDQDGDADADDFFAYLDLFVQGC